MRALTKLVCAVAMAGAAMTAGCGGPVGPEFDSQQGNLSAYTLPPLQYFGRWDGKTPFVPSFKDSTSIVTSFAPLNSDHSHWRVYGADPTTGVIYFQVDCLTSELGSMLGELGKEIGTQTISAAQSGAQSYSWGGAGQLVIKAPPDPNPPTPGGIPPLLTQIQTLSNAVYKAGAEYAY
jgi:hypothetical protein